MRTETFQLSKGTITLTEDKILVLGDNARKDNIQRFVGISLISIYWLVNTIIQYKQYIWKGRPQHHEVFFYLTFLVIIFIVFLYGVLRISLADDIDLKKIKKVKSTVSSATGYPVVQLYLDNHKKRLLQFGSKDDLRFLETLRQRGVHVK